MLAYPPMPRTAEAPADDRVDTAATDRSATNGAAAVRRRLAAERAAGRPWNRKPAAGTAASVPIGEPTNATDAPPARSRVARRSTVRRARPSRLPRSRPSRPRSRRGRGAGPRAPPPPVAGALERDARQHAHAGERHHERGPAEGHERQRHPGDRQQSRDGAEVHERLEADPSGDPAARSRPNGSGALIAMRMPANSRRPNRLRTANAPTRPSSSPRTAKTKSLWAFGR